MYPTISEYVHYSQVHVRYFIRTDNILAMEQNSINIKRLKSQTVCFLAKMELN